MSVKVWMLLTIQKWHVTKYIIQVLYFHTILRYSNATGVFTSYCSLSLRLCYILVADVLLLLDQINLTTLVTCYLAKCSIRAKVGHLRCIYSIGSQIKTNNNNNKKHRC